MPPEGHPPFSVTKRNKRLIITDRDGKTAYCMPDFLKPVANRGVMQALADRMAGGYDIRAIIEFEAAHRRERRQPRPRP